MADHRAGIGEEAIGMFDPLDRILNRRGPGVISIGQPLDLRDIERRVGFQERDFLVDFLAGGADERLVFVFEDDPADGDLTVAVTSYAEP